MLKRSNWNIIEIETCDSTNNYIKELKGNGKLHDRTAIVTNFQQSGRGQATNNWFSDKKKNLLVSFYSQLQLEVRHSFLISVMTSMAIKQLLANHQIDCSIKWPNDIYYGNKKIAGILIENSLVRHTVSDTIIGIGLNVNQDKFPDEIPNPTSMSLLAKKQFAIKNILNELSEFLYDGIQLLDSGQKEDIYHQYQYNLYRLNEWHLYKTDHTSFNGRIHGVEADGRLIIETGGGQLRHFLFGEIEYII